MDWYKDVNDAFTGLVQMFNRSDGNFSREDTRFGEVIQLNNPFMWRYSYPCHRTLLNVARDANPFFHLYEAMWMLAGRNDLESLSQYTSQMAQFSDDGVSIYDAYGFRWAKFFGFDQKDKLVDTLVNSPTTRRAVLTMWSPEGDCKAVLETPGIKAVPCNTHAYFSIREGRYLDMTVCNRSNDLILGALGANAVHFSFLLEYMAARVGYKVGYMTTMSNNLHAYTERWKGEHWLAGQETTEADFVRWSGQLEKIRVPLARGHCLDDLDCLDDAIANFVDFPTAPSDLPFLDTVAVPMMRAFAAHKQRDYGAALWQHATKIEDSYWRYASTQWLKKRRDNWERKNHV